MSIPPSARRFRGFTLVELMIVVVVVGVLAVIAIPKFSQVSRASREAEALPILKQIYTLEQRYKQRKDTYTFDINELEGGNTLATAGRYYDFSIANHASGYCASAAPSTPEGVNAGVSPQSMDANGTFYLTDDCS
ncbi:MAG TPA: prepilin-type N-terminal cleavage/methylation domain-containing protein [Longimicrobiaceae bacterium]|nr:prepilin-type N-terminal cleavage/methylation domain-containing protein [Longimicrobiaceae bacterium]